MPTGSTTACVCQAPIHQPALRIGPDAEDLPHAVEKRLAVDRGVEPHQVVGAQRAKQFLGARQCLKQRRRDEGRVQEEADAVAHAQLPQRLGQRDQVIIVHPDQVVRPQQRRQGGGEARG